ncbi:SRPBCC family protein [Hoyosella sp. G463]|uniref:SRPBCC family protein n=1 Tax=Lolliginicoccus lacisalsi TaxID=2742202 RepID=A0A927JE39_9ACTN|nr:SRPBCC family protein [Lolliginicoccus lacisalsi]MBD8507668.1 SRPBCC family protein [Lolliginicoccus lacisalsi]
MVSVTTSIVIDRPRADVARFAANPDRATTWYENISSVEWLTSPPLAVGSRLAFRAEFVGRVLEYTYEVAEYVPGERLVMQVSEGPFPMRTTYAWADAGEGATRMELTNEGGPAKLSRLARPMIAAALRRAGSKDLHLLKAILEDGEH